MTIHEFSIHVTKAEGLKQSISIAQVKEVLRIVNQKTNGQLYTIIKKK